MDDQSAMSNYVIPEDCWLEILKRLPVKSLGRFRCVCREWNALICSSSFIADHFECSKSKPRIFIDNAYKKPSKHKTCAILDSDSSTATFIPQITPKGLPSYELVGSAKGIVCFHIRLYPNCRKVRSEILLWNPVINKYIKLPESLTHSISFCSRVPIAIGVKPSGEDDLRVLAFRPDESLLEIYSVGQGAWRVLQANIPSCKIYYNHLVRSCVNGAVYWVAADNTGSYMLIRFGFEEEEFSCITLPDVLAHSHHSDLDVAVYCGRLALLQQHREGSSWKIWTRSGAADSWSIIICIDVLEEYNFIYGITHDGQILMTRYHYKDDDDLMLYNSTSESFLELDMQAAWGGLSVCEFVESLVFMDGQGGAVTP